MASTRSRQRKLARDRYERQMVRRAQHQRRRRQVQAGLGAFLVLALIVAGAAWLGGWFQSEPEPAAGPDGCVWQPLDVTALAERAEVGTPPADPPTSGQRTMTMDLDAGNTAGVVEVALDVAADPCATASMEYLAHQGFFDGSICHELTESVALACGDPSGTGIGGPTYAFFGENLPDVDAIGGEVTNGQEAPVAYPRGTVALADDAGRNSSQFMIFFDDYATDQPFWPVIGQVTAGLDLLESIGAAGTEDESTAPAEPVSIRMLTVTDPETDDGPTGDS